MGKRLDTTTTTTVVAGWEEIVRVEVGGCFVCVLALKCARLRPKRVRDRNASVLQTVCTRGAIRGVLRRRKCAVPLKKFLRTCARTFVRKCLLTLGASTVVQQRARSCYATEIQSAPATRHTLQCDQTHTHTNTQRLVLQKYYYKYVFCA